MGYSVVSQYIYSRYEDQIRLFNISNSLNMKKNLANI